MGIEKINSKLEELPKINRVIFWNDPEGKCEAGLQECPPQGVSVLRPDSIGQLKTKVIIEIEKMTDKFLVYAPYSQPEPKEDSFTSRHGK